MNDDKIKPVRAWAAIGAGGMYEFGLDKEYLYVATSKDENFEKVIEVLITPSSSPSSADSDEEYPFNQNREKIFTHKWLDPKCCNTGCQSLFLKESESQISALKKELQNLKDSLKGWKRAVEFSLTDEQLAYLNKLSKKGKKS